MLFPTGDQAWDLEEGGVHYWFSSYIGSRDADVGQAAVDYTIKLSDDPEEDIVFSVTYEFGQSLDGNSGEWDWNQFRTDVVEGLEVEETIEDVLPAEWYNGCFDTTNGAQDSGGDACAWYEQNPDQCGYYDTETFFAIRMCCVCSWASMSDEATIAGFYEDCEDTNDGVVDEYNGDCNWYNNYPMDCGRYDNYYFHAKEMCCACRDFEEAGVLRFNDEFLGADLLEEQLGS